MSYFRKKAPAEEIYEKCACCHLELDILKDVPVDLREHYVTGCGQLCPECYERIQLEGKANQDLERAEMQYYIETIRSLHE